jgi:eukaryotic-like serine/threonine-protein kinase
MSDRSEDDIGALPPSIRRLVDDAREGYEAAWRGGGLPEIESYLVGLDSAAREAVLRSLVSLEAELRDRGGRRTTVADDHARPPGGEKTVGSDSPTTGGGLPAWSDLPSPTLSIGTPRSGTTLGMATSQEPVEGEEAGGPAGPGPDEGPLPERFGRYRVIRALGEGGFGRVYLARDEELGRLVAIKVPAARTLAEPGHFETMLAEARVAAGLRHPAIVGVHDVGRDEAGATFVVLEYVEGTNLSDLLRRGRPAPSRLAEILARVAEAIHHAHKAGLVHRDLKPANILIDDLGEPRVTDFGLAIGEEAQPGRSGEVAGTPEFMAPEQVRGEAHRLDGRTDVWALGVALYLGLTGRLPFSSRRRAEVFDEILHRDPRPPRQIDDALPRELERICLKCLSRRMTDRYQTAADLAEDLRSWKASADIPSTMVEGTPAPSPSPTPPPTATPEAASDRPRVIPKGLRSFDGDDSDFFLGLLPGPRGRDGLPEAIRFWKARVDSRDGDRAFGVGLLYGPSGCGKSSLVRAGLLPRLSPHVAAVYVEATPQATEERLRAALLRRFPALPPDDPAGLVAALREGRGMPPGGKVLVVLDQFEQWLHAHPTDPDAAMVRALRQCDGVRIQALVLVRDDFWMAVTRFFQALEVPLVEGSNSAAVELFDAPHARRVLAEFGRAFGRVPEGREPEGELSQFLDRAVGELAGPDGRVIPVRLSLLAEMVRRRPWVPATLQAMGGFEGIGVTFLEETFGPSAPPTHRLHARAAQGVLRALLPEAPHDLKGGLRTASLLREASGYDDRPADFAALMGILDAGLRLVTPVDTEADPDAARGETCYQLTHDYLVPPLRGWLTRKQRETRRGRAELRLASIASLWRDRPEPRLLPSLTEWLGILGNTRRRSWTEAERRMMRAATRRHLSRLAAALGLAAALALAARELEVRSRSSSLLDQALKADFRSLPGLIAEADAHRGAHLDRLRALEDDPKATPREREVAAILLYRASPTERGAERLRARLRDAEPEELAVIREALAAHPERAGVAAIRARALDEGEAPGPRLRAACALARLDPNGADLGASATAVAAALLREDRRSLPRWVELLGPAVGPILPALETTSRDPSLDPITRSIAAEALAEALARRGDGRGIARALVEAPPEAFAVLVRALDRPELRGPAIEALDRALAEDAPTGADESARDAAARRRANAAVALLTFGHPDRLWPLLRHRDDPRLRSLLIRRLAGSSAGVRPLLDRLRAPEADPSERQAILLCCAEMGAGGASPQDLAALIEEARSLYLRDPDGGVHSASGLLLRRRGRGDVLAACDAELGTRPGPSPGRGWYPGPNGHTFVVVPGPLEFWMGSPEAEEGHREKERRHFRRIDRALAVATAEVSRRQLEACDPRHRNRDDLGGGGPDLPANAVSWYEAARYCNWLSERAGIPRDQWCYPPEVGPGMTLDAGAVERAGYRLPTEAEWEYLCRAGTRTSRPFGESQELLPRYAWTWLNSQGRSMPVGLLLPNDLGLFDVLGNQWEWCHDGSPPGEKADLYPSYPEGTPVRPADDRMADHQLFEDKFPRATKRYVRGGAYDYAPTKARSAERYLVSITLQHAYLGFRPVRTLPRSELAIGFR